MSLKKFYSRINWENYPSEKTPLNESNLNKIDSAVDELDTRVVSLDVAKADTTTVNNLISSIELDEDTGIFTITKLNGVTKTIDTKLEKIIVNFDYDKVTHELKLTLDDGTVQKTDLSALIDTYEFLNSDTITFNLVGNKVTPSVIKGSITGEYLEPNYLANVTVQAQIATQMANNAESFAQRSESAMERSEEIEKHIETIVNVDIATTENVGLVKPDGETIEIEEDGTIKVNSKAIKMDSKQDKCISSASGSNIHITDSVESNMVLNGAVKNLFRVNTATLTHAGYISYD